MAVLNLILVMFIKISAFPYLFRNTSISVAVHIRIIVDSLKKTIRTIDPKTPCLHRVSFRRRGLKYRRGPEIPLTSQFGR